MRTKVSRKRKYQKRGGTRQSAFTLVEMMVGLVIMMLLFGIAFIPLNSAFNFFHIGQTRASLQQSARQSLEQIANELRTAVRVFPNDRIPGVTDKDPYKGGRPYINNNKCDQNPVARVGNLSRIDFIPADVNSKGEVVTPVKSGPYMVTYYARRYNPDPTVAYEAFENPVMLYRAQSPIRFKDDTFYKVPSVPSVRNVDTSDNRYETSSCDDRSSAWLMQSTSNEPNFEKPWAGGTSTPAITSDADTTPTDDSVPGSHVRAIPIGTALDAPKASLTTPDYTPTTTFIMEDSNLDGKIDRVKINLVLQRFDLSSTGTPDGQQPDAQVVRASTTVDLPNVK